MLNEHVGLKILGALDVGGAIFVHAFGAAFGLAAAAVAGRGRDITLSSHLEASSYRVVKLDLTPEIEVVFSTTSLKHRIPYSARAQDGPQDMERN